jgi:hypothetical protein
MLFVRIFASFPDREQMDLVRREFSSGPPDLGDGSALTHCRISASRCGLVIRGRSRDPLDFAAVCRRLEKAAVIDGVSIQVTDRRGRVLDSFDSNSN